jgi:hypothetical protein
VDNRFIDPIDLDSERAVTVSMYALGVALADVVQGVATVDVDLTPFATSVRQTQGDLSLSLAWHLELYGVAQPKARRPISVATNGAIVFVGLIESVSDYRLSTGSRTMSVTARTRDATPAWRETPRVTETYPQGTRLDVIARDVAGVLLSPGEILLPALAVSTPQSSTQLAELSAWAMLEALLLPAGFSPGIDALGRLGVWSRDVLRPADILLTEDRLLEVSGGRSTPAVTRLQVKWMDPVLSRVEQQDRVLGQANITAGYFQLTQRQEVWFSDDHTQRARGTRLVVRQSANSGLLPVCDETYRVLGEVGGIGDLHGLIELKTSMWVPLLVTDALAGLLLAAKIPDYVQVGITGTGVTLPYGRLVHALAEMEIMLVMMSMGTGSYEVWGIPYDYVNARNTTEAYDRNAQAGDDKPLSIETDFVMNEDHAQALAGREFLYAALSASSFGLTMVDDLRVQVGDILELPDATRLFVTGFDRDLTFGAKATLAVQGFQIPAAVGA